MNSGKTSLKFPENRVLYLHSLLYTRFAILHFHGGINPVNGTPAGKKTVKLPFRAGSAYRYGRCLLHTMIKMLYTAGILNITGLIPQRIFNKKYRFNQKYLP
jgi:hypothetical protein